jgi:hypothetical protein
MKYYVNKFLWWYAKKYHPTINETGEFLGYRPDWLCNIYYFINPDKMRFK